MSMRFLETASVAVLALGLSGIAFGQCDTTCPDGAVQDEGECASPGVEDPNGGCNVDGDAIDTHQAIGELSPDNDSIVVCGDVGGYTTEGDPVFCDEDLNEDEVVDGADIGLLLGNWGNSGVGDIDGSGTVDGADLGLLLGAWGDCPAEGEPTDSRDLDWLTFSLTQPAFVTVSATHQAPDGNPSPIFTIFIRQNLECDEQVTLQAVASGDCPFALTSLLPAGDHVIILTVNDFGGGDPTYECPVDYVATISAEFGEFEDCGDPDAGDCLEANGTPGCDDFECCEAVCAFNAFCCDIEWDSVCAGDAFTECGFFMYECNATAESPPNDCATMPQEVSIGDTVAFDTTNAETDGPDHVECNSANSDLPIWKDVWYLLFSPNGGPVSASNCFTADFDSKIAAYDVGTDFEDFDFLTIIDAFIGCNEDCADDPVFASTLDFETTAGHYYLVRLGGYENASGTGTITFTGSSVPENDECANAIDVGDGETAFDTAGATTSAGFDLPVSCDEGFGLELVNDIWYVYTATCTGTLTVSTCDSADFDTRLAAYSTCDGAALVGCNDDGDGCSGFTSIMTFDVTADTEYLIRIGSFNASGSGTVTITCE